MKAQKIDDLRRQIELIPPDVYDVAERKNRENAIALEQRLKQPEPAPAPAAVEDEVELTTPLAAGDQADSAEPVKEAFGDWLRAQAGRKGWIGDLGKALAGDRGFPRSASPDDVRKRLGQLNASGDDYEALDDAELDWASLRCTG